MALAEPSAPRRTGSLHPGELAHAAITGALCAAIALISVVVPFAAGVSILGTVPMGLLAYRHRLRVLVAATVAGGAVAFLVAGMGGFMTVVNCAYVGGLIGIVKRRGRGASTAFVGALIAGLAFGAVSVGALLIASRLRGLIFETIDALGTAIIDVIAFLLGLIPAFAGVGPPMHQGLAILLRYWPLLMIVLSIFSITFVTMIGWWAMTRVLTRLSGLPDFHKLESVDESGLAAPVPVAFTDVRFRYPGMARDALGPVSLVVARGEHVAVTGANGSGKTTLTLLMSGRAPSSGTVSRPGAVGLGRFGGTAVVMQHPESQVLGTRVVDDVVWGLPPGVTVDVDRLLGEVGLDGLGERETHGLSGGELQRLAVAAALAREPSILVADEVTSMVDQRGRDGLMDVLSGLTRRHDMSLVHITHYDDEASSADRTINLTGNLDNVEMVTTAPAPAATVTPARHVGEPLLELRGVSHEYASGTPWASTSLRDVEFTVADGDGLLIHGSNGSGKSTLAWIMAGLLVPSAGTCLLDGEPVSNHVGAMAISFQSAHLQLMRERVDLELASAGGFDYYDHRLVEHALARVGLDPALGLRRVHQLSGGQMRRVVLAGLLARSPRAIILDEPLAGLDAASREGLLSVLQDLRRNDGLTVIVISHDFSGLEELCPRTLHLRDGRLETSPATVRGAT